MLSKAKLKQYQQLSSKKFRQKYGLFIVEGLKSVQELLRSDLRVETILCTEDYDLEEIAYENHVETVADPDFKSLSQLEHPQGILAVVHIPKPKQVHGDWQIALDRITDPGNLGTIMRIADWYGITSIYAEKGTVDAYNPKVIQASMGSFIRVQIVHADLQSTLNGKTVFATVLNGQNIRNIPYQKNGVILIGNESQGIDPELLEKLSHTPVTIPGSGNAESLNAAIATAICCDRLISL